MSQTSSFKRIFGQFLILRVKWVPEKITISLPLLAYMQGFVGDSEQINFRTHPHRRKVPSFESCTSYSPLWFKVCKPDLLADLLILIRAEVQLNETLVDSH